jgi:hypothetical protein
MCRVGDHAAVYLLQAPAVGLEVLGILGIDRLHLALRTAVREERGDEELPAEAQTVGVQVVVSVGE